MEEDQQVVLQEGLVMELRKGGLPSRLFYSFLRWVGPEWARGVR